ncbi:MAG: hypothetical protein EPN34_00825 [Burkholderiaceae bacterium]|nr:MAG: hypothetical protein EPN34_00825 [Burkholderiaceae bacterium]
MNSCINKIGFGFVLAIALVSAHAQQDWVQSGVEAAKNSVGENDWEHRSGAKFGGIFDIKGIRVGMDVGELNSTLMSEIDSSKPCIETDLTARNNPNSYPLGDLVYECNNTFNYNGRIVPQFDIYLYKSKVTKAVMGFFKEDSDHDQALPRLVTALTQKKWRVPPKIYVYKLEQTTGRSGRQGTMAAIWSDSSGDRFDFVTHFVQDITGAHYKNGVVEMARGDMADFVEKRQLEVKKGLDNRKGLQEKANANDM